ncbi:Por secretion system C-terminal sorting domain-containing protein [Aquiflexum balticum DSM 16537]|uniref:Por secretion system C-terminal sorting domain-containing protein n=1 Tax=Aquiflexum balticum DSM 16537 TaxID=758820 RepID=A0A1W2H8Y4_9BACT|nr:T9SS type A sorting domain-containing protein [Aquiflexum balticum]SMD45341.1 Por secretion system C-terminal sorting domain-containing protein [Aquiflexum balticum DSM 16537]
MWKTINWKIAVSILSMMIVTCIESMAQITYTWVGLNGGSWTSPSNWSPSRTTLRNNDRLVFDMGGNWSVVGAPSQTISGLFVVNNTTLTLSSTISNQNFTINNGAGIDFLVEENSSLTISGSSLMRISFGTNSTGEINGELVIGTNGNVRTNGTNCILTVNGKIRNEGGNFANTTVQRLIFGPNSVFEHARNTTNIPIASWNASSTVIISGLIGAGILGTNQNFGNFIFRSPNMTFASMNFSPLSIRGDLIIDNGISTTQLRQTTVALNVSGDFIVLGGNYAIGNTSNATRTIRVGGDFQISGGSLFMTRVNGATGVVEVNGDFLHEGGTITQTGTGRGRIAFVGDGSLPQTFSSNGTITNRIDFLISPGSYLEGISPNSNFLGAGNFSLGSGATLVIQSPEGITASGPDGMVKVTGTRNYSSEANYIYRGNSNQIVGNGLPATINNLTIENLGGNQDQTVSLLRNTLVNGDLNVFNGILDLGEFTLQGSALGGLILESGAGLRIGGNSTLPENFASHQFACDSSVEYYGSNQDVTNPISPTIYGILILSGTGIKTLPLGLERTCNNLVFGGTTTTAAVQSMEIAGDLIVEAEAVFQGGDFTHEVGGNWLVSGTYEPGNGVVLFQGSDIKSISGGTFNQVSITGSGLKVIEGNTNISGAAVIQSPVQLTDGTQLSVNGSALLRIENSGAVSSIGNGRIVLNPGSRYLNYSTSNPLLEVQQELQGSAGWRMIGTPVNTTYADFLGSLESQGFSGSDYPSFQPNVLWFDETDLGSGLQAWRMPNEINDVIPTGRGHYIFVFNGEAKPDSGTYSDNLPLITNGTGTEPNLQNRAVDFGVTFTPREDQLVSVGNDFTEINVENEGFNLISNPTASYLNFFAGSGWVKTNLDNTIYVWDPASNNFLTHNGTIGSLNDGILAPFQAFWIKSNAPNPSLQLINNDPKTDFSVDFLGRKTINEPFAISLKVMGEGMEATSFISFGKEGKEGKDPQDAYQLESLSKNWLFLYSYGSLTEEQPMVINHQSLLGDAEERIIPLHIAASNDGFPVKGSFLLDWKLPETWPADKGIFLMDHLQEMAIDMQAQTVHVFNFEAPVNTSHRLSDDFFLPQAVIFDSPFTNDEALARKNPSKPFRPFTIYIGSAPDGRNQEYLPAAPKLFDPYPNPFQNNVKIRFFLPEAMPAEIRIYDTHGRLQGQFPKTVYPTGIHELEWETFHNNLSNGLYIVHLLTDQYTFTKKLIKN